MQKSLVLVVDDDDDNANMLEAALELAGFAVRIAKSTHEAKAVLEQVPVDALVTDYSLGDGTAIDLLASIGVRRPRVAVLVTGHGSDADKERSAAAGFEAHLVKPIALKELQELLRAALG